MRSIEATARQANRETALGVSKMFLTPLGTTSVRPELWINISFKRKWSGEAKYAPPHITNSASAETCDHIYMLNVKSAMPSSAFYPTPTVFTQAYEAPFLLILSYPTYDGSNDCT